MKANKETRKQIKELAQHLPPVFEQHMSGGDWYDEKEGKTVEGAIKVGAKYFRPHVYNVKINHKRRMRHAFEQQGIQGVKDYLDNIHKLQLERSESVQRDLPDNGGKQDTLPDGDSILDGK